LPDFIILANARWDAGGRGGNSSQQYAQAVLRRGWRLCYIQQDGARLHTPLEALDLGPNTVVMCDLPWVEFYLDLFLELKARGCRTVYRIVDNFYQTVRRDSYSEERECAFIRAADAVFASSPLNVSRFQEVRADIGLLRNGVNLKYLWAPPSAPPGDLHFGKPTVAFVASFWDPEWIDWPALLNAARVNSAMAINVLGDVERIPKLSFPGNVHLLGKRPWPLLKNYIHFCDAGLSLYRTRRTRFSNPLKVLEYLACGRPAVSCPNPSISDYPYLYFYRRPQALSAKITTAAAAVIDKKALYHFLEQHTWEARLDVILSKLGFS